MARSAKRSRSVKSSKAAPVKVRRVARPAPVRRTAHPLPPAPARVEKIHPTTPSGRAKPAVPKPSPLVYQPPRLDFMDPARALAHARLKPGMTVADLGAGSGFLTILAARQLGPMGTVYAVDILQDNLRAIKSQAALFGLTNISTIWADLEVPGSTRINDGACDVVLLFKVLCQQEAYEKTVREAVRIAKPGGRIVVTEWAEARFGFCPPERIVQKATAVQVAQSLGLNLIEEHTIDSFHYMLEFKKA